MTIISFRRTRNERGIAVFNVVFILIFIGVLAISGVKMYGSKVARGKINDSKMNLENHVQTLTAWAVANGRLPTAVEYPGVFGGANPLDGWGNPVMYIFDAALTAPGTGGLCGRTTTVLANNAFALVSKGEDFNFQSTADAVIVTVSIAAAAFVPSQQDVSRVVTLDELRSKAGCFGPTSGRLRVLNNELPRICSGSSTYSATVLADGGVPPYTWTIQNAPAWLACNGAPCGGTFSGQSLNLTVASGQTAAPPVSNLAFRLTDLNANATDSRILPIFASALAACGGGTPGTPGNPISFNTPADPTVVADNWNGGQAMDGGTTEHGKNKINFTVTNGTMENTTPHNATSENCIWFQRELPLTGKTFRAYFTFDMDSGEGFVFGLVPAVDHVADDCHSGGNYLGFGPDIPGGNFNTRLGLRFDADPITDCITKDGSICTGGFWTFGSKHHVRVELDSTAKTYKTWICRDNVCGNTEKNNLKNIATPYTGSLTATTVTLSADNITDLSKFFMGFTAGQHGNNELRLLLGDMDAALYP